MMLSPNFSLTEFTDSQTAARMGIDNDPPVELVPVLKATARCMEDVRDLLGGKPVLVSSAYRSPELNAAIGGSKNSQHMSGEAVDFTCPKFGTPEQIVKAIKDSPLLFDQCILEFYRWVHISFSDRNRRQTLIIDKNGTRSF
jgi:zinc D-Ala-D-Ala carboxypeptidase